MFQSSAKRFRAFMTLFDDVLGDPPAPADDHPHRRPLRWERERRAGTVPGREGHCVSPVRPATRADQRDRAAR